MDYFFRYYYSKIKVQRGQVNVLTGNFSSARVALLQCHLVIKNILLISAILKGSVMNSYLIG